MLKEMEFAEDIDKLKRMLMYKVVSEEDYLQESRLIKSEYRFGLMDPSREVARIEKTCKKQGKARNAV